jgi:hypothetical protein
LVFSVAVPAEAVCFVQPAPPVSALWAVSAVLSEPVNVSCRKVATG